MFSWKTVLVETERRYDEMDQARRERLVRQVMQSVSMPVAGHRHWVNRLGSWLVRCGSRLQTHYALESQQARRPAWVK